MFGEDYNVWSSHPHVSSTAIGGTLLSDTHKVFPSLGQRDKVSRQNKTTNGITVLCTYFNLHALRMQKAKYSELNVSNHTLKL
jgi:hypothetical protein